MGDRLIAQHDAALKVILAEWNSSRTYANRIAELRNGTGLANGFCLIGDDGPTQTVFNDDAVDTLTGSDGRDWFLANGTAENGSPLHKVTDKAASELWDDIDF